MSVLFSSVKYMFKNFWYVLLFAVLPAIFLALSLDYRSIHDYVVAFLTGEPRVEFLDFFCIWSLFHFHSFSARARRCGAVLRFVRTVRCGAFVAALCRIFDPQHDRRLFSYGRRLFRAFFRAVLRGINVLSVVAL